MVDGGVACNKLCDNCRIRVEYAYKLRTEIIDTNEQLGPKPIMITKLKSVANTEFYRIVNVPDDSKESVIDSNVDIQFVDVNNDNSIDVEYLMEDGNSQLNESPVPIELADEIATEEEIQPDDDEEEDDGEDNEEGDVKPLITKQRSAAPKTKEISKAIAKDLNSQVQVDADDAVSFLLGNSHLLDKMQGNNKDGKSKGRPHACKVCSKSFLRKSNLVDHLRLHANLRLYQCEYCEKSFVQAGNFKSHLRIHTKERPFKCTLCPKTYNQSSALKVHKITHLNLFHLEQDVSEWN